MVLDLWYDYGQLWLTHPKNLVYLLHALVHLWHEHNASFFTFLCFGSLQGSAKLEKAEILQMTVEHLRHLHQTRDPRGK